MTNPDAAQLKNVVRSLTSRVSNQIRTEILAARLKPGTKLKISAMMEQFDAGLSAVREALSRLVAEGFVHAEDQRGFFVSPVSSADLEDTTRTKIQIEGLALRLSIERGGVEWESAVLATFHELSRTIPFDQTDYGPTISEAWCQRHARFHEALVSACGSPWLLRFRETLYNQSERYRRLASFPRPLGRDVQGEHKALVDAALRRDVQSALEALSAHYECTMLEVMRRI